MAYNLRSRNQKGKCGLLTESEDETFESEVKRFEHHLSKLNQCTHNST